MRFDGKVALVTGAGQGIGAATARRLAAEGASVVLMSRGENVEGVAGGIREAGGKAVAVIGDAGDAAAIDTVLATAEAEFGIVDACVCAAAISPHVDFFKMTREEFSRTLAVNLEGPFLLGQAIARKLVEAGRPGSIVNITSTSTRLAGPQQASYCASKGGLDSLTRVMAVALAPHGIRVNAVAPGPTATGMASDPALLTPALKALIESRTPLGRFSTPDEQAAVIAFVLSDEASFMTGESVYVDGGRTALNYTMPPRAAG